MKRPWLVNALALLMLMPSVMMASEYRCADKVVSVGDRSAELFLKCGEPDWKQSHTEEFVSKDESDGKQKTTITVEEWTYNLGPDRFTRIFKIQNGEVVDVRSGGYGSRKDESGKPECGGRIISEGDRAADVVRFCGEPAWKDKREESIKERIDENTTRKVTVTIEEWTYNFGPNKFLRIFTLRNGVVTDIRTGAYGN